MKWRSGAAAIVAAAVLAGCSVLGIGDVRVRIHNASALDFDSVLVSFPRDSERYGAVDAGGRSRYATVAEAYAYAYVEVWVQQRRYEAIPIDWVGEERLSGGDYAYVIDVIDGQLHLELDRQ